MLIANYLLTTAKKKFVNDNRMFFFERIYTVSLRNFHCFTGRVDRVREVLGPGEELDQEETVWGHNRRHDTLNFYYTSILNYCIASDEKNDTIHKQR